MNITEREAARFWASVDRGGDEECWRWTAALSKGYGNMGRKRADGTWGNYKAHRFAYELLIGPIPDGLQIDHLCRNRACVNPRHLEPVTNRDNGLRGVSVAARNAVKTHCDKGHEYTAENTMLSAPHGWINRECRQCYRDASRARFDRSVGVTEHQCPECGRYMNDMRGLRVHSMKVHGVDLKVHGSRSMYVSGCRCELCAHCQRKKAA